MKEEIKTYTLDEIMQVHEQWLEKGECEFFLSQMLYSLAKELKRTQQSLNRLVDQH